MKYQFKNNRNDYKMSIEAANKLEAEEVLNNLTKEIPALTQVKWEMI